MSKRALTAIARKDHSKPYKYLIKNNYIEKDTSVLDFGCGRGYDVNTLANDGYNIKGYDKYHSEYDNIDILGNNGYCFDLVTCNYVFNVIEDIEERRALLDVLRGISHGKVIITVRADSKAIKNTWVKHNDGWLTPRGTFQKFYTLEELELFCCDNENWDFSVLTNNSNEIMISMKFRRNVKC